jgi:hypothetical protein
VRELAKLSNLSPMNSDRFTVWPSRSFRMNKPQFEDNFLGGPIGTPRFLACEKDLGPGARIFTNFCSLVSINIYLAFKHMRFLKIYWAWVFRSGAQALVNKLM